MTTAALALAAVTRDHHPCTHASVDTHRDAMPHGFTHAVVGTRSAMTAHRDSVSHAGVGIGLDRVTR